MNKGQHYRYFLFINGRRTRSKFLHLLTACRKATMLAALDRKGTLVEVIERPSSRIVAFARKDRKTRVQLYWHTRRRLS